MLVVLLADTDDDDAAFPFLIVIVESVIGFSPFFFLEKFVVPPRSLFLSGIFYLNPTPLPPPFFLKKHLGKKSLQIYFKKNQISVLGFPIINNSAFFCTR